LQASDLVEVDDGLDHVADEEIQVEDVRLLRRETMSTRRRE
jgi:hypothetical protein